MDYLMFEKRCTRKLDEMFYNEPDAHIKEMMRVEILRQRIALSEIWFAMGIC
jgi:hypothetical protein